jgi:hypothetical protein
MAARKLHATSSAQRRSGKSGALVKERIMKSGGDALKGIDSISRQDADRSLNSRLQIAAVAVGLAVLLVGGARTLPQIHADQADEATAQPSAEVLVEPTATVNDFPHRLEADADRASDAAAQPMAATQTGSETFVYFPSQYVNQATVVEPHIEAF